MRDLIQRICLKHRFYGHRRVTATLRRQGMVVNAKKVQRLMREDNLLAQRKAPFLKPPADRPPAFLIVPNLVRGLVPSAPDQIWVADITYVHLARAFVYLAVILDAFSRKAVGWALENTLDASLAIAALDAALAARKPQPGSLIHHADRGVQGGFKRSSQHSEVGGCDERCKAPIGAVRTSPIAIARTAVCCGTR
ncbi:transposase InsO family protein [Bradyrhizobium sp. LM2.7]